MAGYILNLNVQVDLEEARRHWSWSSYDVCCPLSELLEQADKDALGIWSAHSIARRGDICFMAAAKSGESNASRLIKLYDAAPVAMRQEASFRRSLYRALAEYKRYAGKIIGYAELTDDAYRIETRYWASMGKLTLLDSPLVVNELDGLVQLNRFGGVTRLDDEVFNVLKAEFGVDQTHPSFPSAPSNKGKTWNLLREFEEALNG